jgi:Tol biopolymer transport system component
VLPLNGVGEPRGEPLQITSEGRIFDLDWADNKTIVFSSNRFGGTALWTIPAPGGVPERLTLGSDNAFLVSVAQNGKNLVYTRALFDSNIWRVAGPGSDRNSPATKLIASTQSEGEAEYSPDGKKIVFNSNRSGNGELWVCDAEGHDCKQLTSSGGQTPGSPRWSPDGKWIAFDSPQAGNMDIYVISADGGPMHRVTTGNCNNVRPSWSRDGRWIYFGSNRNGDWQIWKSPKEGGQAVQVTKASGAREAFESSDGKFVYYAKLDLPGLWKVPVQGGGEIRALEQGRMDFWALSKDGILFFDLTHPVGPALEFYTFAKRRTMLLQQLPKSARIPASDRSISISTDEQWILYTELDQAGSDLMLLENFR